MQARARRNDPATSHEAAAKVDRTGRADSQRRQCLEFVQQSSGYTAAEIALAVGLERHVPSRRLPELRDAGMIRTGPARRCRVTGNSSLTWEPEDGDPQRSLDL